MKNRVLKVSIENMGDSKVLSPYTIRQNYIAAKESVKETNKEINNIVKNLTKTKNQTFGLKNIKGALESTTPIVLDEEDQIVLDENGEPKRNFDTEVPLNDRIILTSVTALTDVEEDVTPRDIVGDVALVVDEDNVAAVEDYNPVTYRIAIEGVLGQLNKAFNNAVEFVKQLLFKSKDLRLNTIKQLKAMLTNVELVRDQFNKLGLEDTGSKDKLTYELNNRLSYLVKEGKLARNYKDVMSGLDNFLSHIQDFTENQKIATILSNVTDICDKIVTNSKKIFDLGNITFNWDALSEENKEKVADYHNDVIKYFKSKIKNLPNKLDVTTKKFLSGEVNNNKVNISNEFLGGFYIGSRIYSNEDSAKYDYAKNILSKYSLVTKDSTNNEINAIFNAMHTLIEVELSEGINEFGNCVSTTLSASFDVMKPDEISKVLDKTVNLVKHSLNKYENSSLKIQEKIFKDLNTLAFDVIEYEAQMGSKEPSIEFINNVLATIGNKFINQSKLALAAIVTVTEASLAICNDNRKCLTNN